MISIPGRIPVSIYPIFWLFAALIGWLNSGSLIGVLVWVGIIFVSVLIHEYGHAITAVYFGQKAKIQLIALGGVTSYQGSKLSFWKQFIIVFNGPFFGFMLFLLASLFLRWDWSQSPTIYSILKITQVANLFWTVVNLLPVMPLDGGQLLRIVLEASFGLKGFRAALFIGTLISLAIALYFILVRSYLIAAIFFLFTFQSFVSWRKSSLTTEDDREGETRDLLSLGEKALEEGKKEEAKGLFEKVKQKGGKGLLQAAASQYLAILYADEGKNKEAYELLFPLKDQIADELKPLLHKLAEIEKNYPLVKELSQEVYQITQNQDVALKNARAFAILNEARASGGWLLTAWRFGGLELSHILSEEAFQKVKDDSDFKEFTDQMT